jgi:uncharacterized protein (DUF2336 family)
MVGSVHDLTLAAFPFLASLSTSDSPKDRRIWLRVASDHFVAADPSDREAVEIFTDAMVSRLNAADAGTRLEIARKLAPCARTPPRLLALFESVESEAGDFILQHAVAYDHQALAQAVGGSKRRAMAVAKREDLSPQLVDILARQDDTDVLVTLAGNAAASLEGATLLRLLRRARKQAEDDGDGRLADALLERRPVKPDNAVLFLTANPRQRIEILLAAQRTQLGRPASSPIAASQTALEELERTAVARQPERFVALLAQSLNCSANLARRIVDDPSGEPLAIALTALGAANEVLVRVLISNDLLVGRSFQRIRALANLNNALDRGAAMLVIAALRDEPLTHRRHQSATDGSAAPPPSRGASTRQTALTPTRLPGPPGKAQERSVAR